MTPVSVRYWVFIADQLMDSDPQWPDGLRPVECLPEMEGRLGYDPAYPGAHWWLLEDDGAPATLEGKRVELTFTRSGDRAMIGTRNPAF